MTSERKVAIITGASRGIGAGLLEAYRDIGYHVVASSRSIGRSDDPSMPAVDGDIASAKTADRIVTLKQLGPETITLPGELPLTKPIRIPRLERAPGLSSAVEEVAVDGVGLRYWQAIALMYPGVGVVVRRFVAQVHRGALGPPPSRTRRPTIAPIPTGLGSNRSGPIASTLPSHPGLRPRSR